MPYIPLEKFKGLKSWSTLIKNTTRFERIRLRTDVLHGQSLIVDVFLDFPAFYGRLKCMVLKFNIKTEACSSFQMNEKGDYSNM